MCDSSSAKSRSFWGPVNIKSVIMWQKLLTTPNKSPLIRKLSKLKTAHDQFVAKFCPVASAQLGVDKTLKSFQKTCFRVSGFENSPEIKRYLLSDRVIASHLHKVIACEYL